MLPGVSPDPLSALGSLLAPGLCIHRPHLPDHPCSVSSLSLVSTLGRIPFPTPIFLNLGVGECQPFILNLRSPRGSVFRRVRGPVLTEVRAVTGLDRDFPRTEACLSITLAILHRDVKALIQLAKPRPFCERAAAVLKTPPRPSRGLPSPWGGSMAESSRRCE